MNEIGYYSEPEKDYVAAIRKATGSKTLIEAIQPYEFIAWDALDKARKMSDSDFKRMLKGKTASDRGHTDLKWADEFSMIYMPETMFKVSMVAIEFHVPWGTAYIRLKEMGRIREENGRAYVDLKERTP